MEQKAANITRARILLKADEGLTDRGSVSSSAVQFYKAYSERGLAAFHRRNPDRDYELKLDGRGEAH